MKPAAKLGSLGKRVEGLLDKLVGLGLLRDMAEFFQAFGPLYDGFRERAVKVEELLRSQQTLFVLVAGPGEERIADTMFFARRLRESGYRLGPIVVNRVHPQFGEAPPPEEDDDPESRARRLLHWLGQRDRRGLDQLRDLIPDHPVLELPLLDRAPTDLASLEALGLSVREAASAPAQ